MIKTDKIAWNELAKLQSVFRPMLNFRFMVSLNKDYLIEINSTPEFKMWTSRNYETFSFKGRSVAEAMNALMTFFQEGNKVYIKKDSQGINLFAVLSMENKKWKLEKKKMEFDFFSKQKQSS